MRKGSACHCIQWEFCQRRRARAWRKRVAGNCRVIKIFEPRDFNKAARVKAKKLALKQITQFCQREARYLIRGRSLYYGVLYTLMWGKRLSAASPSRCHAVWRANMWLSSHASALHRWSSFPKCSGKQENARGAFKREMMRVPSSLLCCIV